MKTYFLVPVLVVLFSLSLVAAQVTDEVASCASKGEGFNCVTQEQWVACGKPEPKYESGTDCNTQTPPKLCAKCTPTDTSSPEGVETIEGSGDLVIGSGDETTSIVTSEGGTKTNTVKGRDDSQQTIDTVPPQDVNEAAYKYFLKINAISMKIGFPYSESSHAWFCVSRQSESQEGKTNPNICYHPSKVGDSTEPLECCYGFGPEGSILSTQGKVKVDTNKPEKTKTVEINKDQFDRILDKVAQDFDKTIGYNPFAWWGENNCVTWTASIVNEVLEENGLNPIPKGIWSPSDVIEWIDNSQSTGAAINSKNFVCSFNTPYSIIVSSPVIQINFIQNQLGLAINSFLNFLLDIENAPVEEESTEKPETPCQKIDIHFLNIESVDIDSVTIKDVYGGDLVINIENFPNFFAFVRGALDESSKEIRIEGKIKDRKCFCGLSVLAFGIQNEGGEIEYSDRAFDEGREINQFENYKNDVVGKILDKIYNVITIVIVSGEERKVPPNNFKKSFIEAILKSDITRIEMEDIIEKIIFTRGLRNCEIDEKEAPLAGDDKNIPEVDVDEYGFGEEGSIQTSGLNPCLALSLWDPETKFGSLAHLSAGTDTNRLVDELVGLFVGRDLRIENLEARIRSSWYGWGPDIFSIINRLNIYGISIMEIDLRSLGTECRSVELDLETGKMKDYGETVEGPNIGKKTPQARWNWPCKDNDGGDFPKKVGSVSLFSLDEYGDPDKLRVDIPENPISDKCIAKDRRKYLHEQICIDETTVGEVVYLCEGVCGYFGDDAYCDNPVKV